MNYSKIYWQIIDRAKSRDIPDCYCERHHILPRSMGGGDEKSNIAVLTAREHFIAHWLLAKIHKNKPMIYAFFSMTKRVGNGRERYVSHSYKYAKEKMGAWMSKNMSGKNHPFYGLRGPAHPHFGMKRTLEHRKKLSELASLRTGAKNCKARAVQCIETGEVFHTITEAQKKHTPGNVMYAINSGGTANGFHFKYLSDNGPRKKLKGYASGKNSPQSVPVVDQFGNRYDCIKDAAKEIGVTGSGLAIALRKNKPCKGRWFYYE